jgi:hypothetical protein
MGLQDVKVLPIQGKGGKTESLRIVIPGTAGKKSGGDAPTLGIIGRLGGVGARPQVIGLVSDADGAIAAISAALKLADMKKRGDRLTGDVIITTHICPNAPTLPHEPVPFMGSWVDMRTLNEYEVSAEMDAILSIDTTKGNRVINQRGFAISPVTKEGYILKVSDDLLRIMEISTGRMPFVFPITTQDITPYGNGLFHEQHHATCSGHPCPGRGGGDHRASYRARMRHRRQSSGGYRRGGQIFNRSGKAFWCGEMQVL